LRVTRPDSFCLSDEARRAADWALEQAAAACNTSVDLILARPQSLRSAERKRALKGFHVACAAMLELGLRRNIVAAAQRTLPTTVNNVVRGVRGRLDEARLVEGILALPEARQFARAGNGYGLLMDRIAALEPRVLKPESAIRSMRSADFRRLDALILAGWGDICQAKIPTAVLIRALLGLPIPSPHAVGESASPPARHSSEDPRCGLSRMGVPFTDPDDRVLRRVRLPSIPIQSSPCRGHRC
jgi:hypothetical protein